MEKPKHYRKREGEVREKLRGAVDPETLRAIHERSGLRHAAAALRHAALGAACLFALWAFDDPKIWIPAAALQGTVILGFIILLHEQTHDVIFRRPRPFWNRALGLLYAFPSAISATQFRIWHLDHHDELGSSESDPKRARLTPKINARWLKALYFTPALFFIYARAAGREAKAAYDAPTQALIKKERLGNLVLHLLVMGGLWRLGPECFLRMYAVPFFVCFPIAFVTNRVGQHYDIDPLRPERWSSRVDGNPVLNFLFLNSNHHLEHHYYPKVPLYNLPRLNRELRGFFERENIPNRPYASILYGWLIKNRKAHTDWSKA